MSVCELCMFIFLVPHLAASATWSNIGRLAVRCRSESCLITAAAEVQGGWTVPATFSSVTSLSLNFSMQSDLVL